MIKLVVTDLDGTMLNRDSRVSKASREAIKKAREKGIKIAVATGRPYRGTLHILRQSGLIDDDNLSIYNTGASIQKNSSGEKVLSNELTLEDMKELKYYTRGHNVNIVGYASQAIYCEDDIYYKGLIWDSKSLRMPMYSTIEKGQLFERINIMGDEDKIMEAFSKIPDSFKNRFYIIKHETFSIEFLNKKAGKANALIKLCEYLDVDLNSEVLVLGDGKNDIEMLSVAKNSVAMGNAIDEVKAICKYQTLRNDEEGFALALERFCELHK